MSEVPLYLARDAPSPFAHPASAVVEGEDVWAMGWGGGREMKCLEATSDGGVHL